MLYKFIYYDLLLVSLQLNNSFLHIFLSFIIKWNGKIEPQLLSTSSSNISTTPSATSTIASSKATLMAKSNITNYAFLDDGSKVKVYVNLPAVGECPDENINLEFTERSLCLTITNYIAPLSSAKKEKEVDDELLVSDTAPTEEKEKEDTNLVETNLPGEDRCLSFGKLYGDIEKATYKKKADKVILILKKKDDKTWSSVCA